MTEQLKPNEIDSVEALFSSLIEGASAVLDFGAPEEAKAKAISLRNNLHRRLQSYVDVQVAIGLGKDEIADRSVQMTHLVDEGESIYRFVIATRVKRPLGFKILTVAFPAESDSSGSDSHG